MLAALVVFAAAPERVQAQAGWPCSIRAGQKLSGDALAAFLRAWDGSDGLLSHGCPLVPASTGLRSGAGTRHAAQPFEHGLVVVHAGGPHGGEGFVVYGGIYDRYAAFGGTGGPLGLPISNPRASTASGASGRVGEEQHFEGTTGTGGRIVWSQAYGAHALYGPVLRAYEATGGTGGWLGLPVSSLSAGPSGYPRAHFEAGFIEVGPEGRVEAFVYPLDAAGHLEALTPNLIRSRTDCRDASLVLSGRGFPHGARVEMRVPDVREEWFLVPPSRVTVESPTRIVVRQPFFDERATVWEVRVAYGIRTSQALSLHLLPPKAAVAEWRPLLRLLRTQPGRQDEALTLDPEHADNLVRNEDYRRLRSPGLMSTVPLPDPTAGPLYQLLHWGQHHYTASRWKRISQMTDLSHADGCVVGFGYRQARAGTRPLLHAWQGGAWREVWTTDQAEYDRALKAGYAGFGHVLYVRPSALRPAETTPASGSDPGAANTSGPSTDAYRSLGVVVVLGMVVAWAWWRRRRTIHSGATEPATATLTSPTSLMGLTRMLKVSPDAAGEVLPRLVELVEAVRRLRQEGTRVTVETTAHAWGRYDRKTVERFASRLGLTGSQLVRRIEAFVVAQYPPEDHTP
jgi:hypothetical protein